MKPLTKRQVKILVLSICGAMVVVIFVVLLVVSLRLKSDKLSTENRNKAPGQQQKDEPGPGDTVEASGGSQDKKDAHGRPLKPVGSIQETEGGAQNIGKETATNTIKPKINGPTDPKPIKVVDETSTATPLKEADSTGRTTELVKEALPENEDESKVHPSQPGASKKSESGTSVKVSEEEKRQLTTESVTAEALNTLNSQQVDDLIVKSKVVTANTDTETLTLNSNVSLLSLAKKVKEEYASDANAQAWMNSGFRMQAADNYEESKAFENLWKSHLALPKDDKKRAIFREMLTMASKASRNRAGMYEENRKYAECENNIVEATIAEYLQLKVMTDSEASMDAHKCCMLFMKKFVKASAPTNGTGSDTIGVRLGAAVLEGTQIMKAITEEVVKRKEHHQPLLHLLKTIKVSDRVCYNGYEPTSLPISFSDKF